MAWHWKPAIVSCVWKRVLNKFFENRDFPYLKLGIRDFKAKSGRDSVLKVCVRVRMSEITLKITGLHGILGRDHGIGRTRAGQMGPSGSCPLRFLHVVPARKRSPFGHIRNLFIIDQACLLKIAGSCPLSRSIKTQFQYPAILNSRLVNNAFIKNSIRWLSSQLNKRPKRLKKKLKKFRLDHDIKPWPLLVINVELVDTQT